MGAGGTGLNVLLARRRGRGRVTGSSGGRRIVRVFARHHCSRANASARQRKPFRQGILLMTHQGRVRPWFRLTGAAGDEFLAVQKCVGQSGIAAAVEIYRVLHAAALGRMIEKARFAMSAAGTANARIMFEAGTRHALADREKEAIAHANANRGVAAATFRLDVAAGFPRTDRRWWDADPGRGTRDRGPMRLDARRRPGVLLRGKSQKLLEDRLSFGRRDPPHHLADDRQEQAECLQQPGNSRAETDETHGRQPERYRTRRYKVLVAQRSAQCRFTGKPVGVLRAMRDEIPWAVMRQLGKQLLNAAENFTRFCNNLFALNDNGGSTYGSSIRRYHARRLGVAASSGSVKARHAMACGA